MTRIKTIVVSINRHALVEYDPRSYGNVLNIEVRTENGIHHLERTLHGDDLQCFFDQIMAEATRSIKAYIQSKKSDHE